MGILTAPCWVLRNNRVPYSSSLSGSDISSHRKCLLGPPFFSPLFLLTINTLSSHTALVERGTMLLYPVSHEEWSKKDPPSHLWLTGLWGDKAKKVRHLGSDKVSLIKYSRSSEKGKCNNFFKYFGPFSFWRSPDTFLFGKVHCDILHHSLHLLIALSAPWYSFQDTLGEGRLLAAALQLTASWEQQIFIDVLWALDSLFLQKCDGFSIRLDLVSSNRF